MWNDMPADTADFTSLNNLNNFKKSIMRVDITAHLKCFSFMYFVYLSI